MGVVIKARKEFEFELCSVMSSGTIIKCVFKVSLTGNLTVKVIFRSSSQSTLPLINNKACLHCAQQHVCCL